MSPPKLIIDTDPGVDDVLALLLALSAPQDEAEVIMISVTYGNVPREQCARNVLALFNVLEDELSWRRRVGKSEGYNVLRNSRPILALGAEHPLEGEVLAADYFHGLDGLQNVHGAYPQYTPADNWKTMFEGSEVNDNTSQRFIPSKEPAHKEMLRLLRGSPADSITIVAMGPLTNVALAAAEDPETFLRVKEVIVMGGSVHAKGNVTPVAEFNTYADPVAAARVYALTSPNPSSTMPASQRNSKLGVYPDKLSSHLRIILAPLDITVPHVMKKSHFEEQVKPHVDAGSPLALWASKFILATYDKMRTLQKTGKQPDFSLHDPLTIWYAMTQDDAGWQVTTEAEDLRVETTGEWTRGMHVIDERNRKTAIDESVSDEDILSQKVNLQDVENMPGDHMGWLNPGKGNRINRLLASPGVDLFSRHLLQRLFG
ncbi:hypothetical protein FSARC_278 [Fusarium sarcochroum]|uniref:Inosine/uridine-preferring nucleoside hydrolase domain-containing protein n=1 Tax=Fusarium sarcochroum TaxID=1208366 RepID=A0A8H4UBM6_9HYPO|nr:hypothetical protein FSARC_278 [Fusarium sarcochroum]